MLKLITFQVSGHVFPISFNRSLEVYNYLFYHAFEDSLVNSPSLKMSSSEHYQNLENLFHQAHQQFTATARSMIHMLEQGVLGMDSYQELRDHLDRATTLLNEMEELGLAMVQENPYTEQYSVSDVLKLQCLHTRAALDQIRAGLAPDV